MSGSGGQGLGDNAADLKSRADLGLTAEAQAKAKADEKADKLKTEADEKAAKIAAKAKADAEEARAAKIARLRKSASLLERSANMKAPLKSVDHPFDMHRAAYLAALKLVLGVLGRENDPKETPVTDAQVDDALHLASIQITEAASTAAYSDVHDGAKAWLSPEK